MFNINKLWTNSKYIKAWVEKVLGAIEIGFNLTHHIARKIFASTLLLYNDVPMEIVSKLLGHSKMQTTQDSYGKVVERKISLEMKRLKGSG